jgi:hypothetical protein
MLLVNFFILIIIGACNITNVTSDNISFVSGIEPTIVLSLAEPTNETVTDAYTTDNTYYIDTTSYTTSFTSSTPCVSSSLFSIAFQLVTSIISGNSNSTISNPCSKSSKLTPLIYMLPLMILINERMRFS